MATQTDAKFDITLHQERLQDSKNLTNKTDRNQSRRSYQAEITGYDQACTTEHNVMQEHENEKVKHEEPDFILRHRAIIAENRAIEAEMSLELALSLIRKYERFLNIDSKVNLGNQEDKPPNDKSNESAAKK